MKHGFVKHWIIAIALSLGTAVVSAAEKAQYWSFWDASQNSTAIVDHSKWSELLTKYVVTNHPSGINRFRYAEVEQKDKKQLRNYIRSLESLDPRTYNRNEQKAYWINLYNAVVVQEVLDNYPVKNITDIDSQGADGPWDEAAVTILEQKLSLNDIEHRILRPLWKDYKVHFALACGGLGCPNLRPEAFTGRNIRAQLKQAARDFINHPRAVRLGKGRMRLSHIFQWYRSDFAKDNKGMLKLFAHYVDDRKALYVLGFQGKFEYQNDWTLNAP